MVSTVYSLIPTAPPGPLTVPNFSTLNETCLTVSWAPPTTGGVPTSYNVNINDSNSPVVIPDNGSSLYTHTFTGLTSNTPYSISVVAINCAGTSNTATVTNYTCKLVKGIERKGREGEGGRGRGTIITCNGSKAGTSPGTHVRINYFPFMLVFLSLEQDSTHYNLIATSIS